jgi:hypothetical protein
MGTNSTFRGLGEQETMIYWFMYCLSDAVTWNVRDLNFMRRQGPVVELLTRWKAEINPEKAAGALCGAAGV